MISFAEDYLSRLDELHSQINRALDGLPTEALDWSPGPEMNSIGVLATHLLGAERYWIGDVAAGDLSGRDRASEFAVKNLDAITLQTRIQAESDYARRVLEKFSLADLEQVRTSPRDGRQFSVGWALLHALEHTALHCGHIQVSRQLWEQTASK